MKNDTKLKDSGAERALLSTILKNGKNTFIDSENIVCSSDFSLGINRAIYQGFKALSEDSNCEEFDLESLKLKMKTIGYGDLLNSNKELEYIELLEEANFDKSNTEMFAYQIKKYAILRDLYSRYKDASNYLENLNGNETLAEIIRESEGKVIDYVSGVENSNNSLVHITQDMSGYINQVLSMPEIDQVGLPTGFPIWDDAIGGGIRRGTIAVVGARMKVGKSWDALNKSINVASRGIPTLYLDSELTQEYQRSRMISIRSQCPIYLYETRKFKYEPGLIESIREAAKEMEKWPLYYESIGGMGPAEILAIIRRWLVKHVGFNNKGEANDCMVVYDYMKLTSGNDLSKHTPEYILLGLLLSDLHNFAVKYSIPILGYVQLNREGIDSDETDIVAGSDRILWLCSSMSILRNKNEADIDLGCTWKYGNKKLICLETRHGSGHEKAGDYINLHCSLRPNVAKIEACGLMTEGLLYSEVVGHGTNIPTNNRND